MEEKKEVKTKKTVKRKSSTFGISEVVGLIVITCVVSMLFGYFIKEALITKEKGYEKVEGNLQDFISQYNDIIENYYGELDEDALLKKALEAVLDNIDDEYSSVIDTTDNQLMADLNGEYKGIGLEVMNDANLNIIVKSVFEDSPAAKAGMKAGDVITKFNNIKLENSITTYLTSLIASTDEEFVLEIKRGEKVYKITLEKAIIYINPVKSQVYEKDYGKVGYLSLSAFSLKSHAEFKKALDKLEKDGIESLIIDLRGNTGGHLSQTVKIMNMFVDSTKIIYQTKDNNEIEKYYSEGKVTKTYPIVVLTDKQTASASEMLTGMLKDNLGAYQIGLTTFGKGTVQDVKTYEDMQYKYTTKEWLTPSGTSINKKGLVPNKEVKETEKVLEEAFNYLKEKAQ